MSDIELERLQKELEEVARQLNKKVTIIIEDL